MDIGPEVLPAFLTLNKLANVLSLIQRLSAASLAEEREKAEKKGILGIVNGLMSSHFRTVDA